jgi:hypothetical protein
MIVSLSFDDSSNFVRFLAIASVEVLVSRRLHRRDRAWVLTEWHCCKFSELANRTSNRYLLQKETRRSGESFTLSFDKR